MTEDISKYAPPSDELLKVLDMRLYDIMNQLCSQMMKNGKKEDWIGFKAHNGINSKQYELKLILKEIE